MSEPEFLATIGITKSGTYGDHGNYVVDLGTSDFFGKIFSILDKSDSVDEYEDNQLLTEQGSSLIYISNDDQFMLNLLAD